MKFDTQTINRLFGGSLKRYMDGMDMVYSDNVLYMGLFYSMPNESEIADFKKENNLFYITTIQDVMIISMKAGGLSIAESSFHIQRQNGIEKIRKFNDTSALSLCVLLIDSVFGTVKAQKTIKASDGFRNVFFNEVQKQLLSHDNAGKAVEIMYNNNTEEISEKMNKESFFIAGNT